MKFPKKILLLNHRMQADKNTRDEWAAMQEEAVLSLPSDLQSPGIEKFASIWSGFQTKNLKAV